MDSDRPGRVLTGLGSFLAAGPASPAEPDEESLTPLEQVAKVIKP